MSDPRPACLVTNVVSPYREEPFRLLCEAEDVDVIAWEHEGAPTQLGAVRLAASGRYRAVICGMSGRVALPGSFLAARRARVPFVLWATIWSHPQTLAHALSWLPMRQIYRRADAVATYGPHISEYVAERRGSADDVFVATQAAAPLHLAPARPAARADERPLFLFVGRFESEKGIDVLLEAWRRSGLAGEAELVFVGEGPLRSRIESAGMGVSVRGALPAAELPPLYASASAVVLPSIRTRTFVEPWGLVTNEAMHQGTPVVASDAVGAVAGGLVRDGRNGLVFPAGDAGALATRLATLARNGELRAALGRAAQADAAGYTPYAWAAGMRQALAAAGAGRPS